MDIIEFLKSSVPTDPRLSLRLYMIDQIREQAEIGKRTGRIVYITVKPETALRMADDLELAADLHPFGIPGTTLNPCKPGVPYDQK